MAPFDRLRVPVAGRALAATRVALAVLFALPALIWASASAGPAKPPRIELPRAIEGLLDNGLRLIVCPRDGEVGVALHLVIHTGAAREDSTSRAAARLVAAALARADVAGWSALTANGGRVDASADLEHVEVRLLVPKGDLEKAAKALVAAVSQATLPDGDLAKARGASAIPKPNTSDAALALALSIAFDGGSDDGSGGAAGEVPAETARAFAKTNLRPSGGVLAVVGDVDAGDTFNSLREIFATWARQPQTVEDSRLSAVAPEGDTPRRAIAEVEKGRGLCVGFAVPDRDQADAPAIAVIAELLRERYENSKVELRSSMFGGGFLSLRAESEWDEVKKLHDLESDLFAFLATLGSPEAEATKDALSADRLAKAVEAITTRAARDLASVDGLARRLAHDELDLEDWRGFEREAAAVAAVDADAIRGAARRLLTPARAVVGFTGSVQRALLPELGGVERAKIENGPSLVVDRREGTGLVSVAIRLPTAEAPGSFDRPQFNRYAAALLAQIARANGATGDVETTSDNWSSTIAFDVLATRAEGAIAAICTTLRDGSTDPALVKSATAECRRLADERMSGLPIRVGSVVLEPDAYRSAKIEDSWTEPALHAISRSEVIVGVVGDIDLGAVQRSCGGFRKSEFADSPLSGAEFDGSLLRGLTPGDSAIVARAISIAPTVLGDAPRRDLSAILGLDGLPDAAEYLVELQEGGLPATPALQRLEVGIFPTQGPTDRDAGALVIAASVEPKVAKEADAALESIVDAIAKRGITSDDLARATKRAERAKFERALTPRGQAWLLVQPEPPKRPTDAAAATQALRDALNGKSERVLLWPEKLPIDESFVLAPKADSTVGTVAAVPASRTPTGVAVVASPARVEASPEDCSIAELEARFGKNLLEPDPTLPHGIGPPPGAKEIDVLRRWYGDPPGSLNVCAGRGGDSNVVDSLCEYVAMGFGWRHREDPAKWAPAVADFAAWSKDHKVVTVRIRPGIHWQFPAVDRADKRYAWLVKRFAKGAPPLTARDVAFTHRVFMDPTAEAGGLRGAYEGSSVAVLDDHTFQVTWEAPTTLSFVYSLNFQTILPEFLFSCDEDGNPYPPELLGKGVIEHWYNTRMCGYGPYEFVRMDPAERIVLRRMDDFPIFRPAVRELRWEISKDPEQVAQRLLAGTLDGITLQPQQFKSYYHDAKDGQGVKLDRFVCRPYKRAEYLYIGWNTRRPLFADPAVRRALAYAIDRESIVNRIYLGAADAVDGHLRREHPYFVLPAEPYTFDLDRASQLLEDAGWKDGDGNGVLEKKIDGKDVEFRFTFTTFAGAADSDQLAALLKSDLAKIGIIVEVRPLIWATMREEVFVKHEYDAFHGNWGTSYEVDFRGQFHSRNGIDGMNYGGYSNPEIDKLTDSYVVTFDPAEQKRLAARIQQLLFEDQPYAWLVRRERMTVLADWVDNVNYGLYRPQLLSHSWCRKAE